MSLPKPLCDTICETERAFSRTLELCDLETLMTLWADDDDVSCIFAGGIRASGHRDIRRTFSTLFAGANVSQRIYSVMLQLRQQPNLAILSLEYKIVCDSPATLHPTNPLRLNVTNILVRNGTAWRVFAHHSSAAPEDVPIPVPCVAPSHESVH